MSARVLPSATSLRPALARSARITAPLSRLGTQTRQMSGPYGYTQAKALVFSDYGEPKDVLRFVHPAPFAPMKQ